MGGLSGGMDARMNRVRALAGGGDVFRDDADSGHWQIVREFAWARGWIDQPATGCTHSGCVPSSGHATGCRRTNASARRSNNEKRTRSRSCSVSPISPGDSRSQ